MADQLTDTAPPTSEESLEEYLSRPTVGVVNTLEKMQGDLIVLGAGGKMGFSLCQMARRALDSTSDPDHEVLAVSRFGDPGATQPFHDVGIRTIAADLMEPEALSALPDAENVVYLVGSKFGSSSAAATTWAINGYLPTLVAQRFRDSRIVALSTGNVYGFSSPQMGGSLETEPPAPVGEYAQSCLARERLLEYFSTRNGTPMSLIRLMYAHDLRYGVLVDIGKRVLEGEPIDVSMGFVNVIWQGDANAACLRALDLCAAPPTVLNVTGPEVLSVRRAAEKFAGIFGAVPLFMGEEHETALLANAGRHHSELGYPDVPVARLIEWVAAWLQAGGRLLGKPTKFEIRDGAF